MSIKEILEKFKKKENDGLDEEKLKSEITEINLEASLLDIDFTKGKEDIFGPNIEIELKGVVNMVFVKCLINFLKDEIPEIREVLE